MTEILGNRTCKNCINLCFLTNGHTHNIKFFCCSSTSKQLHLHQIHRPSVETAHGEYQCRMPSISCPCTVKSFRLWSLLVAEAPQRIPTRQNPFFAGVIILKQNPKQNQPRKPPPKPWIISTKFNVRHWYQLDKVRERTILNMHERMCSSRWRTSIMKNIWIKLLMLGRKSASKSKVKLKYQVLPLKPFIKCHNNGINWTRGKNPEGTMALVSDLSPIIELSWKTATILLFSPVILLPANLWTLIIKALRGKRVMEKCGSGLSIGTSLDGECSPLFPSSSLCFLLFSHLCSLLPFLLFLSFC